MMSPCDNVFKEAFIVSSSQRYRVDCYNRERLIIVKPCRLQLARGFKFRGGKINRGIVQNIAIKLVDKLKANHQVLCPRFIKKTAADKEEHYISVQFRSIT